MTQTVGSLLVHLKGDARGLVRATQTGAAALAGFGRAASRAALVTGAVGLAAGGAAVAGLVALGRAAAGSVDETAKLAKRLQVTVPEAQKLSIAAAQSGASVEQLQSAMGRLTREAGEALNGSARSAEAFGAIGISVERLRTLEPFELLGEVTRGLAAIDNPALRAAAGADLLGRSWQNLAPLIDGGARSFDNARLVVDRLGLGLAQGSGEVEAMNDNLDTLGQIATALRDAVFVELAPALTAFTEGLKGTVTAFLEANGGGRAVAQMLARDLVGGVRSAIGWFGDLYDVIASIGQVLGTVISVIQSVGSVGAGLAAGAASFVRGDFAGVGAIASAVTGDVRARFDEGDTPQLDEARRQTQLLEAIARKEFGAAFQ